MANNLDTMPQDRSTAVDDSSIRPRTITTPAARRIAQKGTQQQDGISPSDVLLESIIRVSRKPQNATTRAALRVLVLKYVASQGLDF